MASYEIEHNVPQPTSTSTSTSDTTSTHPPRRPDLSTFFSTLEHVDTSAVSNDNALPVPSDVSAAFRTLAEAYERMRLDLRSGDGGEGGGGEGGGEGGGPLEGMIEVLVAGSRAPPKEVKGVSQGFLDELERVPNKLLKPSMDCPICSNPFLDDEYPLVVRLPCNKNHMFDLECIAPWLKLHATCPLDRKDLVQEKKPPPPPPPQEEEEEEWDDMYA